MGYTSLKIAAFMIQVMALILAIVVIVLFISGLIIPGTIQRDLNSLAQEVSPSLGGIVSGVATFTIIVQIGALFSGLFTSLIIFAFGGLVSVVVDISRSIRSQDYRTVVPPEDDDPVNPKPWASFPPSALPQRPKRQVRPTPKDKWDVGK